MTYETFREACRQHINPSRADETVLTHYHTLVATMHTDMTPRYAPTEVLVLHGNGGRMVPVTSYVAHPPGNHPANCPLVSSVTALELRTEFGSRWYGCERAYINSELRMVVVGTNKRDEVRMKWKICEAP